MNYEQELQALRDAQIKTTTEELQKQKEIGMTTLSQQEAQLKPKYALQRQQASTGSQMGAKNFAEFLANRGLTSSGTAGEGEIARTNQLNQNLGTIQTAENEAMQGIQNQRTNLEMQTGAELSKQQGAINLDYMKNVFNYKQAQEEAKQKAIADARKTAQNNVGKITKISNIPLSYQTGLQGVKSGSKVVYNIPNQDGSITQASFNVGTNPFTGTVNKNLLDTEKKYDPKNAFSNGYQPNNIKGTKLVDSEVIKNVNGQDQKVWAKGTGNNATLWYWDGTKNDYQPYTG